MQPRVYALCHRSHTARLNSHEHMRHRAHYSFAMASWLLGGLMFGASRRTVGVPAPHKDFSDLYEKMSGKGASAGGAHRPRGGLGRHRHPSRRWLSPPAQRLWRRLSDPCAAASSIGTCSTSRGLSPGRPGRAPAQQALLSSLWKIEELQLRFKKNLNASQLSGAD